MAFKVYVDRISQPSRAILLLCKVNGIEFDEVKIQLIKSEHKSPEFAEINLMKQVPAIVHGDFKLFESHAILIYLSSAFPGVADHWYPADVQKRAKVHSVLDWHHSNLRFGSAGYALNSATFGLPSNPKSEAEAKKIAEAEKVLSASLATIESFWLQEDAPFLLGNSQPSIADLALACEVMQIEVVDEEDRDRILGPHKRILKWIEDVKNATGSYFDELHSIVLLVREKLKERRSKLRPNYGKKVLLNEIFLTCDHQMKLLEHSNSMILVFFRTGSYCPPCWFDLWMSEDVSASFGRVVNFFKIVFAVIF